MMSEEEISKRIDEGLRILKQEPSFIFNLEEIKAIEHFSNYPTNWDFCFEVDKKAIDTILSLISKLQKELDKKDKVIDLMAQERAEICETRVSKEAIIDFYYKKVEEENE